MVAVATADRRRARSRDDDRQHCPADDSRRRSRGAHRTAGALPIEPSPGWYLYGRVALFADCKRFTPPPGATGPLSDPRIISASERYVYDFESQSPAVRRLAASAEMIQSSAGGRGGLWRRSSRLPQGCLDIRTEQLRSGIPPCIDRSDKQRSRSCTRLHQSTQCVLRRRDEAGARDLVRPVHCSPAKMGSAVPSRLATGDQIRSDGSFHYDRPDTDRSRNRST
jgi:hypothetical protein